MKLKFRYQPKTMMSLYRCLPRGVNGTFSKSGKKNPLGNQAQNLSKKAKNNDEKAVHSQVVSPTSPQSPRKNSLDKQTKLSKDLQEYRSLRIKKG